MMRKLIDMLNESGCFYSTITNVTIQQSEPRECVFMWFVEVKFENDNYDIVEVEILIYTHKQWGIIENEMDNDNYDTIYNDLRGALLRLQTSKFRRDCWAVC